MNSIKTIIFDLGGVLVDWNPVYLFQHIFDDKEEMDYFLSHICTPEWNERQDGGRRLLEATESLIKKYPQYELPIRSFYGRWDEMLGGPIQGVVQILKKLKRQHRVRLFALTNWSAETYPIAHFRYDFLQDFEDIIVSGKERMRKPSPEIYQLASDRFDAPPATTLFIDDNLRNVKAAKAFGFQTIHFQNSDQLNRNLENLGVWE